MMTKKRSTVIGRGLSSLLENPETDITTKNDVGGKYVVGSVTNIPIDLIEVNPFQPRDTFDEAMIQELSDSILLHGVIQPITLRKLGYDKYQLIAGERRLRATIKAGLETIPAFIRIADDEQMLEWALIENIHRENLNPMQIAFSYQRLIDECKLTQEQLSQKINSKRSTVANFLRLLKLPDYIQAALKEEKLSMGHARAMLSIDDPEKLQHVFTITVDQALSVRDVEKLAKSEIKTVKVQEKEKNPNETPAKVVELQKFLHNKLASKVDIKYNSKGKGSIVIPFNSDNELNKIIDKLK